MNKLPAEGFAEPFFCPLAAISLRVNRSLRVQKMSARCGCL